MIFFIILNGFLLLSFFIGIVDANSDVVLIATAAAADDDDDNIDDFNINEFCLLILNTADDF